MLAFVLTLGAAWAAQVTLQADTTRFSEGQSVGLVLTVTETSVRGGVPRFEVPDGLTAAFESQQQQQLLLNYNLTTSTIYRYTLTAVKPGDYLIPSVSVNTAAGMLKTESVSLHVAPRGASSGVNELTGELSETPRWVGQVVVYHLRFATDRRMGNGNWIPPEGKGFSRESGVEAVNTNYTVGEGASRVSIQDLYFPLRFTQAGAVTVPGGALQAQFAIERDRQRRPGRTEQLFPDLGMFTDVRSEVFSAPSISATVREPPAAGRPSDWDGLVGAFTLTSKVQGPTDVRVGDTLTLAVDLVGDSPITGVKLPPLPADGFRVYDDQPVMAAEIKDGRLVATASFKRAIVPERPGPLVLPAITLSAFDPATGQYRTLSTAPITLDIQGAAAAAQVASFSGPAAPAIGPIDELLPVRPSPELDPPWPGAWGLALLLPGVALLGVHGARTLAGMLAARTAPAQRALTFDDLPTDPHGRLSGLDQIFREAVSPRLGIGAAEVHGEALARLGADAAEATAVYRLLERARYAESAGEVADVERALRAFVEKLK